MQTIAVNEISNKLIAENDNVYMIKDKKDRLDCCQALKKAERSFGRRLSSTKFFNSALVTLGLSSIYL